MKKDLAMTIVLAVGFLTPLSSHAFGLGKIELKSALNQPLLAEIRVNALPPGQRELLEISLASAEEFEKAGLDRPFFLTKLEFQVVESKGQIKIVVTSKEAIKEPFLDFLLVATTGQGRLLREYTVLLDPPEFVLKKHADSAVEPGAVAKIANKKADNQDSKTAYVGDTYRVSRNETLWKIALKTRPDKTVSVHQMMLALQDVNPDAFIRGNINNLKAGTTLKLPTAEQISSRSHAQALKAAKQQNRAWEKWKKANAPPAPVVEAETTEEEQEEATEKPSAANEATDEATEKPSAANEAADETTEQPPAANEAADEATEKPSAANETENGTKPRLTLTAPEKLETSNEDESNLATGSSEVESLAEQLTLAQEAIDAKSQENIDLQQRIEKLEEQINTLQRLISVKDTDMARLQEVLKDNNLEFISSAELLGTGATATEDVEQAQTNDETLSEETGEIPESDPDQAELALLSGTQDGDFTEEGIVDELPTDTLDELELEDPQASESVIEQLQQFMSEHKLIVGGGLACLLFLGWFVFRRKKYRAVGWDEMVTDMAAQMQTDASLQNDYIDLEEAATDNATQSPVESATPAPAAEKSVSELILQAEMFIGYADYVQAQDVLEQARRREPKNEQATLKLLFVMYKQKKADVFLDIILESKIDSSHADWSDIKSWGQKLLPEHSLFQDVVSEAEQAGTKADQQEMPAADVGTNDNVPSAQSDKTDSDTGFQLGWENYGIVSAQSDKKADSDVGVAEEGLDFELGERAEQDDEVLNIDIDTTELEDINEAGFEPVDNEQTETLDFNIEEHSDTEGDDSQSDNDELYAIDFDLSPETEQDDMTSSMIEQGSDTSLNMPESDLPKQGGDEAGNLDLGDIEVNEIDEVETKLDLAVAYIDMEYLEGATSILKEVLAEGNEAQKERAQELLGSFS